MNYDDTDHDDTDHDDTEALFASMGLVADHRGIITPTIDHRRQMLAALLADMDEHFDSHTIEKKSMHYPANRCGGVTEYTITPMDGSYSVCVEDGGDAVLRSQSEVIYLPSGLSNKILYIADSECSD